jgi:hypothetical protein
MGQHRLVLVVPVLRLMMLGRDGVSQTRLMNMTPIRDMAIWAHSAAPPQIQIARIHRHDQPRRLESRPA